MSRARRRSPPFRSKVDQASRIPGTLAQDRLRSGPSPRSLGVYGGFGRRRRRESPSARNRGIRAGDVHRCRIHRGLPRQREWDVAIDQEHDRRNDLKQKYRDQIMGDKERADELASRSGRRRAGNEVEEAIQSKDKKNEAKKETSDESNNFHVSFFCLIHSILTSIQFVSS